MKAIARDRYGSTDTLEFRDVAEPEIKNDEVLVRVHAAGLDRGTWHLMAGLPYPVRLMGYGFRRPKELVLGIDLAGVVEAVGDSVTRFRVGDEVFGMGVGSFAELARVREDKLAPKPTNLTFEQAAVVPISGSTALQGLRDKGRLQPDQDVLITGASGGVGTFAVQIAKALGGRVTGVCSTSKVSLVQSLGADRVVDYTRDDFADGEHHYDLIMDIGGNPSLSRLRRALTSKGTLVIAGGETDGRLLGGFDRNIRALLLSPFVSQKLSLLASSENAKDLIVLTELIEAGKVAPAMDRTFPLNEAPDAIRYMIEGRARGKVAITI